MKQKNISVLTLLLAGASAACAQITLNPAPEVAIGTPALTVTNANPNLVQGREFYGPQCTALDTSVSPPILYVSDYGNNRVLAWRNASGFSTGQKADLVVGQPDLLTTFAAGPGASPASIYSTGLNHPSGLAVDSIGNLYVADAGNNRILRYPSPFSQTGQFPIPDLFIGQPSVGGHGANYPTGLTNPQGLSLTKGSTVLLSSLAFDSSGNLWAIDTGNFRVLRFNASALAGAGGGITADLVLGQADLVTTQTTLSTSAAASYYKLNQFISPVALAFDPNGNLFVADLNRALVFVPPFSNGMSASSHILGIYPTNYSYPAAAAAKQALIDQTAVYAPSGFFFLSGNGTGVGVVDAAYNRVMIFDNFSSWPSDGTPPQAKTILGQPNPCSQSPNQTCKAPNNGNPLASGSVFSSPGGAAYTGTDLYLADSGNHRVLDLPQQGSTLGPATRVLGQDSLTADFPNLLEGREFQFVASVSGTTYKDSAIALDNTSGTPHLYVADPYNNRVLGFRDLRKFQNGGANKADIVLGQADLTTSLINYPSGSADKPTKTSLFRPIGLLVDSTGNLYVADSYNGRVLRFPAPFAYAGLETKPGVAAGAAPEPADLVLGQQSFTSKIQDATAATMAVPYGLAFVPACNPLAGPCPAPSGLVVSDQNDNRVLYIPTTNGGFVPGNDNGKAASLVFGQPNFVTITSGNSLTRMNGPHHISSDTNGFVYVADTANNRVMIFPDPRISGAPADSPAATTITGLNAPEGVFTNPATGELWIANTGASTSLRYANYQSVLLGLTPSSSITDTSGGFGFHPLAAVQDQYGDLFVADDAHRVAFYFPGIDVSNGASFLPATSRPLAPGVIASIFACANCGTAQFLTSQNVATSYPLPKVLGDVQVLFDGVPAPLYIVYPGQINFVVPNNARVSGPADLQVVQVSTGQILGATQVMMNSVSPGAFAVPAGQSGKTIYAAAVNQDGTVNTATNPALRGQVISLYLTGQGNVPNAPPDGVQATTAISAPVPVAVWLNGNDVNSAYFGEANQQHILYSGLNQYPGMWQINVQLPNQMATAGGVWFAVIANGVPNWDGASGFKTYIYVK